MKLFAFIVVLTVSSSAFGMFESEMTMLKNRDEIKSAIKIKLVREEYLKTMEKCSVNKISYSQCACQNKGLVSRQINVIKEAFNKHPSWHKLTWFKFRHIDGTMYNYSIKGLLSLVKRKLKC